MVVSKSSKESSIISRLMLRSQRASGYKEHRYGVVGKIQVIAMDNSGWNYTSLTKHTYGTSDQVIESKFVTRD